MNSPTPPDLLQQIKALGVQTNDLRYAVHEAAHAMQAGGVKGPWTTDNIHKALKRAARAHPRREREALMMGWELEARAIEWEACTQAGIDYNPEHWLLWMMLETARDGGRLPPMEKALGAVCDLRESGRAAERLEELRRFVEGCHEHA